MPLPPSQSQMAHFSREEENPKVERSTASISDGSSAPSRIPLLRRIRCALSSISAHQMASQPPVFMVGPPPHCWWHCFYSTTLLRRKMNPITSTLRPAADVPLPAGRGMHLSLAPNHLSSLVPLAASNEPYRYQPQWITPDSQKEPFSSASMPLHTVSSQSMLL